MTLALKLAARSVMEQEQVKQHFAKQADEYEQLMVRIVPQYLEQHEIIRSLLPNGDRDYDVLDLGCGNGVLSELVLNKLPHAHVVGFDLTEDMLKAYDKKLSKYSGRYELKQGNLLSDPIGGQYDIILAGLTLHHLTWSQREQFYKTLSDSLHEGGLLICRDIIIDENESVRSDQYGLWMEFIKSQGEDQESWYSKHMEKDHPVTLTNHFVWLRNAGFIKVACHWRLYNFAITTAQKARNR
jgi:tRNA (cmo5U34)-methyltransferase